LLVELTGYGIILCSNAIFKFGKKVNKQANKQTNKQTKQSNQTSNSGIQHSVDRLAQELAIFGDLLKRGGHLGIHAVHRW